MLDGIVEAFPPRCIFVFAVASALFQILFFPDGFGFGSGWEPVAIARELVRTGTYGNPFEAGPSGPTAVIPPAFPFYLAALLKLLGDGAAFAMVATIGGMLAQAFAAALLPRVSIVFFGDERPGIFAGLLSAVAFRMMPQWDAPYTACALLVFFLFSDVTTVRCVFSGAIAGVLVLMNPASILITAPWMVCLWVRKRPPATRLAAFATAALVTVLPWSVRNQRVLGTLSVKDNFGMTAYASNNDCAESSIAATIGSGCYDAHHPNESVPELKFLTNVGEARYDKLRTADAMRWVQSHPGRFLSLTVGRVAEFWFPAAGQCLWCAAAIWLATALSVPGLVLLLRRGAMPAWYVIAVLALYPLPYYMVVSDVRYRYPLLWASALCAGYLLASIGTSFGKGSGPGQSEQPTH